ncbi:MAG: hypothetical protein WD185_04040 [Sneathiella sp.]
MNRDKATGLIRTKISPENKMLEEFFETEIQGDIALIDYLFDKAADAPGGEFEINGNAFSLTLTADSYQIESIFDENGQRQEGAREDLFYLLDRWRAFIIDGNLSS